MSEIAPYPRADSEPSQARPPRSALVWKIESFCLAGQWEFLSLVGFTRNAVDATHGGRGF